MKSADVFPSKYLASNMLKGKEPVVTIVRVVMEPFTEGDKPVAYFANAEKGMVLNRTNWGMLEFLYGDESDAWVGQKIQIYTAMTTDRAGKPVMGLRVKKPPAQNGGSPLPQRHEHVSQDHGTFVTSTTRAVPVELPDDDIPF